MTVVIGPGFVILFGVVITIVNLKRYNEKKRARAAAREKPSI